MTRDEYMGSLAAALASYSPELRKEIIDDFSEHFDAGQAQGLSDQQIIDALGSVEEVVANIDEPRRPLPVPVSQPAGGVDALQIDARLAIDRVVLRASRDGQISYRLRCRGFVTANRFRLDDRLDGHTLRLTVVPPAASAVMIGALTLEVYLPASFGQIVIGAASADVDAERITAALWEIQTSSGDIELEDGGGPLTFISQSGDVDVDGWQGDITATTISGDVMLSDCQGAVKAVTRSGDIEIDDAQGPQAVASAVSGDVSYRGGHQELTITTNSGDIDLQVGETSAQLKAFAASGDIDVQLDDGLTLDGTASTDRGDLDIDIDQPRTAARGMARFSGGRLRMTVHSASGDISLSD